MCNIYLATHKANVTFLKLQMSCVAKYKLSWCSNCRQSRFYGYCTQFKNLVNILPLYFEIYITDRKSDTVCIRV